MKPSSALAALSLWLGAVWADGFWTTALSTAVLCTAGLSAQTPTQVVLHELEPRGEGQWVELHNRSAEAVSLDGYAIEIQSVDGRRRALAPLPADESIAADGYLAIELEGKCRLAGVPSLCVPFYGKDSCLFDMDKDGGLIVLRWLPLSTEVDRVLYPPLPTSSAYGRLDDTWCIVTPPTPGASNDSRDAACRSPGLVVISETSTADARSDVPSDCRFTGCPDWVELTYVGPADESVDLRTYTLSDRSDRSYNFSDAFTSAGEPNPIMSVDNPRVVVLLRRGERLVAWPVKFFHWQAQLKEEGDSLTLRSEGSFDSVTVPSLSPRECYARDAANSWRATTACTPGEANQTRFDTDLPPRCRIVDRFPLRVLSTEFDPSPLRIFADVEDPDDDLEVVRLRVVVGTLEEQHVMVPGKPLTCRRVGDRSIFVVDVPRPPIVDDTMTVIAEAQDRSGNTAESAPHDIFIQAPDWSAGAENPAHELRINEVAAHEGWVELYNPTTQLILAGDLFLTSDILTLTGRRLPRDFLVPALGFARVWLDGTSVTSDEDGAPHLPFRLQSCRDEVILVHRDREHIIDAVAFHEEKADATLGRIPDGTRPEPHDATRRSFLNITPPTPGAPNRPLACVDFSANAGAPSVVINEVIADNWVSGHDRGNEFGDWIELYNPLPESVDLTDWQLRDRSTSHLENAWSFPRGTTIAPGCYLLVWCDNDEDCENDFAASSACTDEVEGELHTNFEINRLQDYLQLLDPCGGVVDCAAVAFSLRDVSVGRFPDGGPTSFLAPTPGAPNVPVDTPLAVQDCSAVETTPSHETITETPCRTLAPPAPCDSLFMRGDFVVDCSVNIADAVGVLQYLFEGRIATCLDAGDANDDGSINLSDALAVLNHLFSGGATLPPPGSVPGRDLTEDGLTCRSGCRQA